MHFVLDKLNKVCDGQKFVCYAHLIGYFFFLLLYWFCWKKDRMEFRYLMLSNGSQNCVSAVNLFTKGLLISGKNAVEGNRQLRGCFGCRI